MKNNSCSEKFAQHVPVLFCIDQNLTNPHELKVLNKGLKICCNQLLKAPEHAGLEIGFVFFDREPHTIFPKGKKIPFLNIQEYINDLPEIKPGKGSSRLNTAILHSISTLQDYKISLHTNHLSYLQPSLFIITNGCSSQGDSPFIDVMTITKDKLLESWNIVVLGLGMSDEKTKLYANMVNPNFNDGNVINVTRARDFDQKLSFASQSIPIFIQEGIFK